jgi:ADP-heptose:LPS heptosyltransferase
MGTTTVQVHLGAGIGNVVLATPLLVALHELGFSTDVVLAAVDYTETADLLYPWSVVRAIFTSPKPFPAPQYYSWVIPAIPPFYWAGYARKFATTQNVIPRPPDALFYQDEQAYYLAFARRLGRVSERSRSCTLPIAPAHWPRAAEQTLILAPGCKTGEMAAKRWPHYPKLADEFADVAVVGTADDLWRYNGEPMRFSPHVKMFANQLTLRQTAELLAGAGAVVANDTGLAYVAAAVGTPTLILFGPTPDKSLGNFPPNVRVLRAGLACEPCWFGARFRACLGRIDCLAQISVADVVSSLREFGFTEDRSCGTGVAGVAGVAG